MQILRHIPRQFALVLQKAYPLNNVVLHFLENPCNKQRLNMVQVGSFLALHTMYLPKIWNENYFVLHVNSDVSKSENSLCF